MPIRNYGSFNRMTGFCKTIIPKRLTDELLRLKDDAIALYEFGGNYVYEMCQKVLAAKGKDGKYIVPGLHIYTMNTEKCTIELLSKCKIGFENDDKLEGLISSELERVLGEDKNKQVAKLKKQKQKEIVLKATPIDEGKFKEVTSF